MKKKLLSFAIALVVIASSVAMYNTVSPESVAYAADFRSGFKLEPTNVDGTGIGVDTSFILSQEGESSLTVDAVKEGLSIEPKMDVEVTEEGEAFRIRPLEMLPEGSIVVVSFQEVTWAFMTQTDFSLLGVFPRNQSRGVPTSSGIELAFNYAPASVEEAFSIEPEVEGRFEYKDQRAIFIPKALEPGTIYTVTVSGDVSAKDSDEVIGSDTVFQFQTSEEDVREENQVYVQFGQWMHAIGTSDEPTVNWNYYSYDNETHEPMTVQVYKYSNFDTFVDEVNGYMTQPIWTRSDEGIIDVSNRSPEITFDYDPSTESMTEQLKLPEALDKGQYLIQVEWEDVIAQTFLQVSDVTVNLTEMNDATLWWVHDLSTDNALSGASIVSIDGENTTTLGQTGESGFVAIPMDEEDTDSSILYTVQAGNDRVLMSGARGYNRTYYAAQDYYWDYLDTDKGLYQKDDTVQFFGFLQNRRQEEEDVDSVTVSISESRFYYWDFLPMQDDALNYVSEDVSVVNGFYEGELELPNLQAGSYQLTVKSGDTTISSTYLTVDSYTKPSYEMSLTHDKEAVFAGEPITFTVDAKFFEGTPVSYLGYDYRVGLEMEEEGTDATDEMGKGSFTYTPQGKADDQDYSYVSAYVNADLPESGELYADDSVRVFFNDVYLERQSETEEDTTTVRLQLNKVDLDTYNEQINAGETASFIGEPVSGHSIDVTIVEHQWKRRETGEYYDDINNEVVKEYEYYTEEHNVESGDVTTDRNGLGIYEVNLANKAESYYTAEIELKDGKGRKMHYSQYLTNRRYPDSNEITDYPDMVLNQDNYKVGDTVKVNVTQGDQPLEADGYLYIVGQNGLVDATVREAAEFEREFEASDIPNTEIKVIVYRDGTYENIGTLRPTYEIERERIDVTLTTDQDSYNPGDSMTVGVKATYFSEDADMPLSGGHVLIKMVDEALLALNDNSQETLEALYQRVRGGFVGDYQSHEGDMPYIVAYTGGMDGGVNLTFTENATADTAESDSQMARDEASVTSGSGVRSEFKDTAAYVAFDLDSNGEGEATMTLPDNITGWKLTGFVMKSDLKAGDGIVPVDVSLPFFLNTAMNSMYLAGDAPSISATVYGTAISQSKSVEYTVKLTRLSDGETTTLRHTGRGFEQSAIPLGTLEESGDYEIVIEAKDKDGHYDGYKTSFTVYDTYLEKVTSRTISVETGMTFDNEKDEEVGLTFVDAGISRYMSELYRLSYASGKRLDQLYVGNMAKELLERIYDQEVIKNTVALEDYSQEDGGYSLFPYGESEIETTVRMIPLLEGQGNTTKMIQYLRNQWYNDKRQEKGAILYGLASLGEPVLTQLNQYADSQKQSLADQLYVAYAYIRLGDTYKGAELFDSILDKVEEYNQQAFITGEDVNETVQLTGLAMLIAQDLDEDIAAKFYTYMTTHSSDEDLPNAWLMDYIIQATENETSGEAEVTISYDGQIRTFDLSQGYGHTLRLPGATLRNLDVTSVSGDVNVVMTHNEPLTSTESGNEYINVTRHYESYQSGKTTNTFKEGDIVKVVLNVDIDSLAIDQSYRLTDYVPSGLKPIEGYWKYGLESTGRMWYRDISDQKVSFYAYRMEKNETIEPFVYYARIVSIGEFKAEAPMLQGLTNADVIKLGEEDTIEITKN